MALILILSILPSPLSYHSDKNKSTLFREYYFNKFIYIFLFEQKERSSKLQDDLRGTQTET